MDRVAERGGRDEGGEIIIDSALLCDDGARQIRVRGIVSRWGVSRSTRPTRSAAVRLLGATAAVECRFDLHDGLDRHACGSSAYLLVVVRGFESE